MANIGIFVIPERSTFARPSKILYSYERGRYLPFYLWLARRRKHISFASVNWIIQSISIHFIFIVNFDEDERRKKMVSRIMGKIVCATRSCIQSQDHFHFSGIMHCFSTWVPLSGLLLFDQRYFRNNKPINELTNVCIESLLQAFHRIYYSFALWTLFNSFIKGRKMKYNQVSYRFREKKWK